MCSTAYPWLLFSRGLCVAQHTRDFYFPVASCDLFLYLCSCLVLYYIGVRVKIIFPDRFSHHCALRYVYITIVIRLISCHETQHRTIKWTLNMQWGGNDIELPGAATFGRQVSRPVHLSCRRLRSCARDQGLLTSLTRTDMFSPQYATSLWTQQPLHGAHSCSWLELQGERWFDQCTVGQIAILQE